MPRQEIIDAMLPEIVAIRHDLHRHPEILYDLPRTSALVAERLRAYGVDEVVGGIGQSGVVGVVRGRASDKVIGLRADMDALPMQELTNLEYRSTVPSRMHACGHDGHTAMLLGAAKYLAATRDFDGTAVLLSQPAEEGGAGAKAMVDDGLMERFGIQEVYGIHNKPGLPVGQFAVTKGAAKSASDELFLVVRGRGGHAAAPQRGSDPVIAACHLVTALQTIASRNIDPLDSVVISIIMIHGGEAVNVIPHQVTLRGSIRTFRPETRIRVRQRIVDIVDGQMRSFGLEHDIEIRDGTPPTYNHPAQTDFYVEAITGAFGRGAVDDAYPPSMGSEDFSYMLEARPGAIGYIGNGNTAGVHDAAYDFNDEAIPYGIGFWVSLVEHGRSSAG